MSEPPYPSFEEMRKMRKGDKLSCGCEVAIACLSYEEAKQKVYTALARALSRSLEDTQNIPEETTFASLGLEGKQLRKLEARFFIHCDVDVRRDKDGNMEYRVSDSKLPPVPPTIAGLAKAVERPWAGPLFQKCDEHWM
jgi:hypothetical protein